MKEFTSAIRSKQEDHLACGESEARLPEYVNAQLVGTETLEDYAELELHLQVCPHCAAAYRELMALTTSAYIEDLPQPAHQPRFDFSFLGAEARQAFRWDELGRLIIEFSAELLSTLQPPAASSAYVGVKSGGSGQTLWEFNLTEAGDDLEVTITAEETRGDATTCTVVTEVNIPSRGGWPNLAGTQVTLKQAAQERETQTTDAFGKAVFEGIRTDDLARLAFEITPLREV